MVDGARPNWRAKVSQYFDFDDDFLIEKEPHVRHWEMYAD
jgi:hypothetical protein